MAACWPAPPALAEVDAFTSASVTDFYGDNALTGDELMNAINSFSGFYLVCTTNPDGSANAGYFIYGCAELDGKYYLKMGLAEEPEPSESADQRRRPGRVCHAATPAGGERMSSTPCPRADAFHLVVTDAEVLAALEIEEGGGSTHPMRDHEDRKSLG